MRASLRLVCLAALSLGALDPARANSLDSARQLCSILNATGLLIAECAISSWTGTIGLLMGVTAEEAKKTCLVVRDLAAENKLEFDIHWSIAILAPQNPNVPLAECKLEKTARDLQSLGLRPSKD